MKDKIILALGEHWPQSARQLLLNLKKEQNTSVTYQAVYKSLHELESEGIIVKKDGYELDRNWVGALKEYATYLDQEYKTSHPKSEIDNAEQIIVDSLWDFYLHVLVMLEKHQHDTYCITTPCIFRAMHAWNALVIGKEEFNRVVKTLPRYTMYAITSAQTPLDIALGRYWGQLHGHFRTGVPRLITNDVVIIGDYVIQLIYPPALLTALDAFYKETKSIEAMDAIGFQKDIFYKKAAIPVVTVKNKALADSIRDDTLLFFK